MRFWILLVAFGTIGVTFRHILDRIFPGSPNGFPTATFLINFSGSFFIGAIFILAREKSLIDPDFARVLMTGLLGGFTTFSSFSLQTTLLIESGNIVTATIYIIASPTLCVFASYLGITAVRAIT